MAVSALPLASAASRCAVRRLGVAAAVHRSAALLAAVATAAVLAAGLHAGTLLAGQLEPALADQAITRALVVGIALVGLGAGAALGVVLPGPSGLGAQLATAPASAPDRAVAVLGPPVVLVVLGTSVVTLPLALPVAASAPAGIAAAPALVGALVAATATGGMAAWLGRVLGPSTCPGFGRLAAVVSAGVGALGAVAVLRAGDALAGEASPVGSAALTALAATAALLGWGRAVLAPERPVAPPRRSRALRGGACVVAARAAFLLLLRRFDVRAALLGGVLLGLVGIAVARLGAAPSPSGLLLGTTGAALAAAPCALGVGGIIGDGRHVWRLAPIPAVPLALAWMTAAAVGLLPSLAVALTAWLVEGGRGADLGVSLALAVVVWSCALAAGALVPWRRHGVADQALSLAALGVGLGGMSLAASRLGPLLVAWGVPAAAAGTAILAATLGSGLAALVVGLRWAR